MRPPATAERAKVIARNRSPLPRNTVAKKRSSSAPIRSRKTPMNHRNAIPAKGSRPRARRMDFSLPESHVPESPGMAGTETRRSTRLMMSRIENTIPAIAPARGALSWSRISVAMSSFIVSPSCASDSLRLFEDRLDLSVANRTFQRGVVLFVLIGIRDRESGDSFVENVTLAQVSADHRGVPGAGMGERQRVAAPLGEESHLGRAERLDGKLDLDVPELADIVVASSPSLGPAEEDVACWLDEPVTVHDTLSVVREDALPRIGLQDRGPRLLDLENERISSASHQEEHPARGAYAPDADYLDRGVP